MPKFTLRSKAVIDAAGGVDTVQPLIEEFTERTEFTTEEVSGLVISAWKATLSRRFKADGSEHVSGGSCSSELCPVLSQMIRWDELYIKVADVQEMLRYIIARVRGVEANMNDRAIFDEQERKLLLPTPPRPGS